MYRDDESNESIRWNPEVVDVYYNTSDANEADFFVIYDKSGKVEENHQENQEYYLTPL